MSLDKDSLRIGDRVTVTTDLRGRRYGIVSFIPEQDDRQWAAVRDDGQVHSKQTSVTLLRRADNVDRKSQ